MIPVRAAKAGEQHQADRAASRFLTEAASYLGQEEFVARTEREVGAA
jgi:hypothetical protein